MAHPFFNRPFLRQDALLYALLATLAYDAAVNSEILGAVVEWGLFFLAIPARVFLYTCLFLSLPPLVSRLSGRNDRLFRLTALWLAASLALLATMWGVLALGGIAQDVAVKRFTPDTLADFAPGWTMAEVALGKKTAEAYTWVTAITAEALAILGMTLLVAGYLKLLSAFRLAKSAGFAPLLAAFSMGLYALVVPWSLDFDFDIFIGDALIGATLLNTLFLPMTAIFGGFAIPYVWIAAIAAINLRMRQI